MRSMTVGIKADTSGFKKGMDEMIDKLNALNKKLVDNQYSQRDCNNTIAEAKKQLKELQETVAKNGKATEDEEKKMRELNSTIEEQTLRLAQLRTEQASIRNMISETTRTLTDNNDQWTVLKGTLANLASDTLQKLGAALKNVVSDVIQTGEQFTAAISKVGAISGATAEELQQLEDAARLYGSTTMYSAKEAADALQYMALAGWNTEQSIEGLPSVLSLAASSGMDLGRASDIVTDYITAFGLSVDDAARFVDIMSYAMSHSNTTTEMLGEAYKNCAATARSMGFEVEEVTAALMTMANAGVKGGEAGTTLNTLMTRLATDTKGCASALAEYGVRIYDAQGNMKSLSEILSGMVSAWDTLTQKQQANLSKTIAGTNQYAGFQTLMQGMSQAAKDAGMSFEDYTAALKECDGVASQMSSTMTDNLTGDLKAMQSALDELKLKIFEDAEQPLRSLVQTLTKTVLPAVEEVLKHLDKILPVIVACGTAMATVKLNMAIGGIVTKAVSALKSLTTGMKAAQAETAALSAEMKTLSSANVIGLVITAVVSLGSALLTAAAANAELTKEFVDATPKLDAYIKKQKEMAEGYQNSRDAALEERAALELTIDDYWELSQKADLTADEKQRLTTATEELASKLGLTTQELEQQKVSFEQLTKAADDYLKSLENKALRDYYEEMYKSASVTMKKNEDAVKTALQNLNSEKARLSAYLQEYKNLYGKEFGLDDDGKSALRAGNQALVDEIQKHQKAVLTLHQAYVDVAAVYSSAKANMEDAKKGLEELGTSTDSLSDKTEIGTKTTEDYAEALAESEKKMEELAKEAKTLQSQSTSLRSEMNSLASSMKQLENGEALSLNTLLDLIEKYPEYAGELLAARDNVDLQRQALEHLFEAKKNDYIMTQQAAIENIRASQDETKVRLENIQLQIGAYEKLGGVMTAVGALGGILSYTMQSMSLQMDIDKLDQQIADYEKKIEFVKTLKIGDFGTTSGGSGTTKKDKDTEKKNTLTAPHTWNYKGETYTTEYSYTEGEFDAEKDADASAKAYLGVLDRAKALGKLTLGEEISNLQSLLKWEKISADQRYDIRLRLYKAQEQLAKQNADAENKAADEANKALLERQNLALAAYNRLADGKIEALEAESKAAQDSADKQIAALDAVMKKRKEESEDAKRQKELDQINAKLRYQQLDEFERMSLERRRQDILNEQADVAFERRIENQKAAITGTADAIQSKNALAIAGLNASKTQAADRVAYLQGSQTYDQRVKNNTTTQNVTIVQNGLSGDQLINKLLKELGAI